MTHLDRNQGELFEGPTIGGVRIDPYLANWAKRKAIPKMLRLLTEFSNAGGIPEYVAQDGRLALIALERKLHGE